MDDLPKVLYLSYDGLTDPLGQSQILPYLLGLKNYHIFLISFEKEGRFQARNAEIETKIEHSSIEWIPLEYHKSPPILSTLYDLFKLNQKINSLCKSNNIKMVHCRGYLTAILGLGFKKKFGVKLLFDMRAFYADERAESGVWNRRNVIFNQIYQYFKRKEKQLLAQSDFVITLTHRAENIIKEWGFAPSLEVIPCMADLSHFSMEKVEKEEGEKLKAELGINSTQLVMLYVGSIGTWYMLEEMLLFYKVLLEKKQNAVFLFLTSEPLEKLLSKAQELGVETEGIKALFVNREEIPLYMSIANFSIFFIRTGLGKAGSSPVKQGELMGMGIPLICNSGVGDSDRVVEQYNSGILIDGFSEKDFQKAVNEIDSLLQISQEKIVEGAKSFYSLEEGIAKYQKIYDELAK